MPPSSLPLHISTLFGLPFLFFGLNAFLSPSSALSFFSLPYPSSSSASASAERLTLDALLRVYAIRDVFMGVAIVAAGRYRASKALGWIMVAAGAVAGVDGWACWMAGTGAEWNHWGYGPLLAVLGAWLLV